MTLTIRDALGKQIRRFEYSRIQEINERMDVSALSKGIYFATIDTKEGRKTQKLIIN